MRWEELRQIEDVAITQMMAVVVVVVVVVGVVCRCEVSNGLEQSRLKLILSWVDHCCSATAFQLLDSAREGQQRQSKTQNSLGSSFFGSHCFFAPFRFGLCTMASQL